MTQIAFFEYGNSQEIYIATLSRSPLCFERRRRSFLWLLRRGRQLAQNQNAAWNQNQAYGNQILAGWNSLYVSGWTDFFEIDKAAFDIGVDQLHPDSFADIQPLHASH